MDYIWRMTDCGITYSINTVWFDGYYHYLDDSPASSENGLAGSENVLITGYGKGSYWDVFGGVSIVMCIFTL